MILTKNNGVEFLLGLISDELIRNINKWSPSPLTDIESGNRTIRDGKVSTKQEIGERLVLFSRDIRASREDIRNEGDVGANDNALIDALHSYLNVVVGQDTSATPDNGDAYSNFTCHIIFDESNPLVNDDGQEYYVITSVSITCATLGDYESSNLVTQLLSGENPLNVSQFVGISNRKSNIDVNSANEYLDAKVFELLPTQLTRQQRIDKFFEEYSVLKGDRPEFLDYDSDGSIETQDGYMESHDISNSQTNPDGSPISEEDSFITRLNVNANDRNSDKTLQFLRDDLNSYLEDIDQTVESVTQDERPEYENKSEGYLKLRNLNQGIVIRKQEGDGTGLENLIRIPSNTYGPAGDTLGIHPHEGYTGPSYLMNGFTITMWVRFLDKTSRGTLFNYGNPLRSLDPKGFTLETYVLEKDSKMETSSQTWGEAADGTNLFTNSDSERFIRLVVYDHLPLPAENSGKLYDSRIGIPGLPREDNMVPEFGVGSEITTNYQQGWEKYLLSHVRVPIDFDEWYFIVANYNPLISDTTTYGGTYGEVPEYWRGNIDVLGDTAGTDYDHPYTHYSGFGSKCKVEIISKSDLLRARGYKV